MEAKLKSTGQRVVGVPTYGVDDQPPDGYVRVLLPLETPTRKGYRGLEMVVRRDNLTDIQA